MQAACFLIHLSCHQHRWNNLYLLFFLHCCSSQSTVTVFEEKHCMSQSIFNSWYFFYSHDRQFVPQQHHATLFCSDFLVFAHEGEMSFIVHVSVCGFPSSLLTWSNAFLFCRILTFRFYFYTNLNETPSKSFSIRLKPINIY